MKKVNKVDQKKEKVMVTIPNNGVVKNNFGHCRYGIEKDYVHIHDLFIAPEFRGFGKARDILKKTIGIIRNSGYNDIIQIVANPREKFVDVKRLRLFYKKMGLKVFEYYG